MIVNPAVTAVRTFVLAYAPFWVAYFGIPEMGSLHAWGSIAILLGGVLFAATIAASDYYAYRDSDFVASMTALLGTGLWSILFFPPAEQVPAVETAVVLIWFSPLIILALYFLYRTLQLLWRHFKRGTCDREFEGPR
jgi:hypothetical protein